MQSYFNIELESSRSFTEQMFCPVTYTDVDIVPMRHAIDVRLCATKKRMSVTSLSKDPRSFSMPSCHYHMSMILHSVVGPSGEQSNNQSPLVPMNTMCGQQPLFLFWGERPSVDSGIKKAFGHLCRCMPRVLDEVESIRTSRQQDIDG
ncbi:hypothetical protein MRB53_016590 [Persea americana]|uniref:Uncharacterized protein n=1 Tax=Persea americana TaxID=3435 RepID=A0ACC2M289_PERAE|nr:hypothetical protein MRB53_016590 [Persea americana]